MPSVKLQEIIFVGEMVSFHTQYLDFGVLEIRKRWIFLFWVKKIGFIPIDRKTTTVQPPPSLWITSAKHAGEEGYQAVSLAAY